MHSRTILLLAVVGLCGSRAAALPVRIVFDWPSSRPANTVVRIEAFQSAGSTDNVAPVERDADLNGAVLDLSRGVWQLQASAPGYWSQATEVVVTDRASAAIQLSFWPAASLHGEIATLNGEPIPNAVNIRLTAVANSASPVSQSNVLRPPATPAQAELHCAIDQQTWSCMGPAGIFDLRLDAAGFAPRYVWAAALKPAESADLGRTELRRAASVFGRAVGENGSNPPVPCKAVLQPDMERQGQTSAGSDSGPDRKTRYSAILNQRGYFQIVGVVPGRYMLAVECSAATGVRMLRVGAETETRVDPPLLVSDLTLNIAVTPNLDPEGQPWQLVVDETAPHYLRIAHNITTGTDGRWSRRGLMSGNYRVIVKGSDGTEWLQKYFDLGKSGASLSLRVSGVQVTGRVSMNSEPVRARLVFFNNAGGESATLQSDDQGRFQGLLPIAAGAQETNWTVEAHVAQPPVSQQLLNVSVPAGNRNSTWLDLELPAVAVHGSVVSIDGKPQPGVQVTFENSSGVRTTTSADNQGKFEMSDLPAGKYTAVADSPNGSSDRNPFRVPGDSGSELKLVLNKFKSYSFDVLSSDGPVANAAVQVWIKPGVPLAFVRTDENGRFEIALPPGNTEVGLTIGAPGYAVKMTRLRIPAETGGSDDTNTITLDASGGTLVLNFQAPGHPPDSSGTLYLVHNGAMQDARTMSGWGTDKAGASANGPAVIDAIEPGDYALCSVDPAQTAVLWSGPLPTNLCQKGSLDRYGTLTLSPP